MGQIESSTSQLSPREASMPLGLISLPLLFRKTCSLIQQPQSISASAMTKSFSTWNSERCNISAVRNQYGIAMLQSGLTLNEVESTFILNQLTCPSKERHTVYWTGLVTLEGFSTVSSSSLPHCLAQLPL